MGFKKHVFSIGIAIIALVLVIYGIRTFYPDPGRTCYPAVAPNNQAGCITAGGEWKDAYTYGPKPVPADDQYRYYCDFNTKCEALRNIYDRNVAIIAYILGLVMLLYGIRGKKIAEQTTAGFVGGGFLIIIYGTISYWAHLEDTMRFGIVLVIFGFLIWLGNKYKNYFK